MTLSHSVAGTGNRSWLLHWAFSFMVWPSWRAELSQPQCGYLSSSCANQDDKGIHFIFHHSSPAFSWKYNLCQTQTSLELSYCIGWVETHLSICTARCGVMRRLLRYKKFCCLNLVQFFGNTKVSVQTFAFYILEKMKQFPFACGMFTCFFISANKTAITCTT